MRIHHIGSRLMGVVAAVALGMGLTAGPSAAIADEPTSAGPTQGTVTPGENTGEATPVEVGTYALTAKDDPAAVLPTGPLTVSATDADGNAVDATVTDIVWDVKALATAIKEAPNNTVTELTADGTATIATASQKGGDAGETGGTDPDTGTGEDPQGQPQSQTKKDQPVSATVEVVPEGLRYYIDSGTGDVAQDANPGTGDGTATTAIPSPSYDAVASKSTLRNHVSDLRHENDHGTNDWGVTGANNTLRRSTSTSRDATGWYADATTGSISYYLSGLAKGTYHLTVGTARWDGKDRTIEQRAIWKDASDKEQAATGAAITLDADHALAQGGLDVTIDHGGTDLVYTLSRPATAPDDAPAPTIAWLTVVDMTSQPTVIPVTGIAVTADKTSLKVGETTQAKATVTPANATTQAVIWSSSNPKVATVDAKTGKITAVKDGKATIAATSTDGTKVSGSVEITVTAQNPKPPVKPVALTGIKVTKNPAKTTYWVGDKLNAAGLEVTATYANGTTRKLAASDYTLAVFNSLQAGHVAVTITLKSDTTKTTAFTVHIKVKGAPDPNLSAGTVRFKDVTSTTPHRADILWLYRTGISKGYAEANGTLTFGGMRTVVRQDMAAFLYRLAGSPAFDPSKVTNPFLDVTPSTPHYKEILWLGSTGIAQGYADGTFGGMRSVVRQDMAAFLHRFSNVVGGRNLTGDAMPFQDLDAHSVHVEDIGWLSRAGITKGYAVGGGKYEFGGMRMVVRQDMAAFLHRMAANVLQ